VTLSSTLQAAGTKHCGFSILADLRALLVNLCVGYAKYAASASLIDLASEAGTVAAAAGEDFVSWRAQLITKLTIESIFLLMNGYFFAPLGVSNADPETHADTSNIDHLNGDLENKVEELLEIVAELLSGEETGGTFSMVEDSQALFVVLDSVLATPHAVNVDAARVDYLRHLCASIVRPGQSSSKAKDSKPNVESETKSRRELKTKNRNNQPTAKQLATWSNAKSVSELHEVLPHLSKFFARKLLQAVEGNVQQAAQCVLEGTLPAAVRTIQMDSVGEEDDLVELDRGPDNMADLLDMGLATADDGAGGATKMSRTGKADAVKREKLRRDLDKLHVTEGAGSLAQGGADDADAETDEDEDKEEEDEEDEARAMRDRLKRFVSAFDQYNDEYDDALDDGNCAVNDHGSDFAAQSERPGRREHDSGKEDTTKQKWKPGMLDVDGKKRDADGKIMKEEEEDELMRPNLNRTVAPPPPRSGRGRGFGRGGSRGGGAGIGGGDDTRTEAEKAKAAKNKARNDNKNKSSRANHNRKSGAVKKASRGMV
jgi:hypothetical protein